ncbi:MAG: aspartate--tRNA ligase, partial [Candidatus Subteraquimicrobiales bacterium]|nr:aspartate--tRNA ligase [Candidatus Subteraquimicrobiales bacterium]
LRDRSGLVQTVIDPLKQPVTFSVAEKVRGEYVLCVRGKVVKRPPGTENPRLSTGEVEIALSEIDILSSAKTPPFEIEEYTEVDESLRLKYRYLDLRRPDMVRNLVLRHKIVKTVRNFLDEQEFIEVETPILTKSTPEGARDYLVPSRLQAGHFYALPQSPQLFKQLLMIAGLDRYYQIARCFRDEDLRADRQPEHTQIDIEMSFVEVENIIKLVEDMMSRTFSTLGLKLETPFLRLSYDEAMEKYGSDKPDLRFGLEIFDVSGTVKHSQFKVFAEAIAKGGIVAGLNATGGATYTRKQIDNLTQFVSEFGAGGLAWMTIEEGKTLKSPIAKFLPESEISQIIEKA